MGGSIDWPPLREPKLLERLALDDAEFDAFARKLARLVKPRQFTSADAEHAFGYPWPRPRRSYLLSDETATPLERLPAGVLDSDAGDARRRYHVAGIRLERGATGIGAKVRGARSRPA